MLYLAATLYSASAALVAVREERQAKGALCQAAAEVVQGQEGAAKASVAEGQARQGDVAETAEDSQVSGTPPPQEMPQSLQDPSPESAPAVTPKMRPYPKGTRRSHQG